MRRDSVVLAAVIGVIWASASARVASASLLANGDFELASTAEWEQLDEVGFGQLAVGPNDRRTGRNGLRLNPAPGGCPPKGCQLGFTQAVDSGAVTGRRLDFSAWFRTNSGDRGLAAKITLLASGGRLVQCENQLAGGASGWQELTIRCAPQELVYAARVEFATTGTSGSVSVDDLTLSPAGAAPTFVSEIGAIQTAPIPSAAAIVMVSTRHHTPGAFGVVNPDVYAMAADGSGVARLTTSPWEHGRVAVAPDRNRLAVVRFTEDINKDGRYDALVDPQALWVVDLAAGQNRQVTPSWYWGGLGGVAWTPDGEWLVFGMLTGRTASIHRVRPDGSDLERVGSDEAWCTDAAVSPDGEWLAYHRRERNADGTFVNLGEIWVMRLDGSDSRRVSDGGGLEPGTRHGWPVGDYEPGFSPDQTALILSCNNPASGGWDLVRIDLDGGGRQSLAFGSPGAEYRAPDWGTGDVVLFSHWRTGVAPYQGGATVPAAGGPPTWLEHDQTDPSDGGVWVRWMPPVSDESGFPRARRLRRAGGG